MLLLSPVSESSCQPETPYVLRKYFFHAKCEPQLRRPSKLLTCGMLPSPRIWVAAEFPSLAQSNSHELLQNCRTGGSDGRYRRLQHLPRRTHGALDNGASRVHELTQIVFVPFPVHTPFAEIKKRRMQPTTVSHTLSMGLKVFAGPAPQPSLLSLVSRLF